ncbi:hypothetical protein F4778DRAFT_708673 [Xylariomycetidae sp. FL2044]|nr:hypothetical protein F4778DRAFT_708673 [Xylariomycetidae sp. FL2044]
MSKRDASRASSGSPALRMPFIVSSNLEKADPETRKLIRAHVRRGKGLKEEGGRARKPANHQASTLVRGRAVKFNLQEGLKAYCASRIPIRVGSDLSFIQTADEIEPCILMNIIKVSPVISNVLSPLRVILGFERADIAGILFPVKQDAAVLHITAFSVELFIDRILRRQEDYQNAAAILHLQKALAILRERLSGTGDKSKISECTMTVVVKLAIISLYEGDSCASRQHMEGLRSMLDLRGGLATIQEYEMFIEIARCDLSIAILNSCEPVLYRQPSEPLMDYPEELLRDGDGLQSFEDPTDLIESLDAQLATAWRIVRSFCLLVNLGTQTRRWVRQDIIRDTTISVTYRLIHMRFAPGSIDETVHYGLLVFSYHVFMQWQHVRLPYTHIPTKLRKIILGNTPAHRIPSPWILWLLMVGAVSVFDMSEEAQLMELMRDHARRCQVKTWKDMQNVLKSFMWVNVFDTQKGEEVFGLLDLD